MTALSIEPIGVVRTPIESSSDAPTQGLEEGLEGELVFEEGYLDGLDGLEEGTTVDVLWYAHDADRSVLRVRDDTRGVFSTRSPARSNPICVSPCKILATDPPRIRVRGMDMVDGSPLIDVKAALR